MEPKKAWGIGIIALFSMTLVDLSAFAQSGDEMYRQMRKNPSMSKEDHDRIRRETVDKDRIDKMNQISNDQKKQQATEEKQIPADTTADIADNDEDEKQPTSANRQKTTSAPEPRAPAPKAAATSSDSPKVSFDPMPDDIQFPGEPEKPAAPAKPKVTPRPYYKKRY